MFLFVVEEKAQAIRNSETSEQLAMVKKESRVLQWSSKNKGFQAKLHIDEIDCLAFCTEPETPPYGLLGEKVK